tara:strand:- start:3789 stop:5261 length:1473 start_codon:yes stop_codon:yes gene_type:complete
MAIQFLSGVNITGTTSVSSVSNDDATYTGILVWDGGLLKYRTTAQILSDIGATGNTGTVTSVSIGTVSGVTASVTNSTTAATISIENVDKGSSQFIFKNIASDSGTATASINDDTLTIAGGTNVSTARSGNTITINSSDTNSNNYVSSLSFNSSTGVLTAGRVGLSSLTVDLDGRYFIGTSAITGISGTAPVSVSSPFTGVKVVSMAAASASVDGYLTSGNFTTFNNKTSNTGTVTSVGTTGTVSGITLSGTVTNSGNLTLGGTLSLTSANVTDGLGFTPYNATNPAGYTTNTGTTTANNSQTFTNKTGNISQWTNDSGYLTSASIIASKGSWYPNAVQTISGGGTVGTRTTLSLNTPSITAVGMSIGSSTVTITDAITALVSMNFASTNAAGPNRTLAAAVIQYRANAEAEWRDLQGTQTYNYDRGTATSGGASSWGFVYRGSGGASVLNDLGAGSGLRIQFWIEGRASSSSGISSVTAGCRLSITEIK